MMIAAENTTVLTGDVDPDRFTTLPDMFRYACDKYADHTAFSALGGSMTFRELDQYSECFAQFLVNKTSLQPGDRIAIQLPNVLQFPIILMGALKAGLVLVTTNPLYTEREMQHQFTDSGAKGIVILANFCSKLEKVLPKTSIETVIVTELGDMLPGFRRVLVNAAVRHIKKLVPAYNLPQALRWRDILRAGDSHCERVNVDSGTDMAMVLYTGGTTGVAKGAMLTHANLISNTMQLRDFARPVIHDGVDVMIAPLPMYHSYAFLLHGLMSVYTGNHSVLIPNPRDVDSLVKAMRGCKATGFVGINTLYLALCRHKDIDKIDFSNLRFSGAGGMALAINVAKEWTRITGCEMHEGYGLTECSPVVTINPPGNVKLGTVGKPIAQTRLRVVSDEGVDVPAGEKGELWVHGPQVMKGYWQNEAATREVLTEDGWFKTGDYAQIDEEGYVRIVDRKKDMIIVSGFNVFPSEIEEVVNAHPDVYESAVIGVPDEDSGEIVKLFAVLKNTSLTVEQLRAYCKENLTAYKVPKQVEFVKELPKSNVGKVLRRELREAELKKRKTG